MSERCRHGERDGYCGKCAAEDRGEGARAAYETDEPTWLCQVPECDGVRDVLGGACPRCLKRKIDAITDERIVSTVTSGDPDDLANLLIEIMDVVRGKA